MKDGISFIIIELNLLLIWHVLDKIGTEVYFIRCALNRIEKEEDISDTINNVR